MFHPKSWHGLAALKLERKGNILDRSCVQHQHGLLEVQCNCMWVPAILLSVCRIACFPSQPVMFTTLSERGLPKTALLSARHNRITLRAIKSKMHRSSPL